MTFDYGNDVETLVVDSLPGAFHHQYTDWRQRAKAFLDEVTARGWKVVPATDQPPVLTGVPGVDHDQITHEVVLWFRAPTGATGTAAEWRIAPKDILEVVAMLAANGKYALTSVGVALAVGDCATCGNRRLVNTERYGRPWSERCPNCGPRHSQAVAFEDYPSVYAPASHE